MEENYTYRIDSEYFKKDFLLSLKNLEKIEHKILQEISKVRGGKRLPLNENFTDVGIPYIRAQDIKGFVKYEDSPKISSDLHNLLKEYQTNFNDVILTIVGNSIGDVGIVKFHIDKCNLTENCIKIVELENIIPEYLYAFLNSKYGQNQIIREKVGTAQPKLAIERIRKFMIPIPSNNFQLKIQEIIKSAHEKLKNSKSLYSQAEEILLTELGLKDWQPTEETKSVRSFKDSFLTSGRLDAEYYQPKYEEIIEKIKDYQLKTIDDVVNIRKSIEPGSNAYEDNGIPFIRISDLSKYEITETEIFLNPEIYNDEELRPKKDTILLTKDGTLGIAFKVEKDLEIITSGAILHLTIKEKNILPDYLTLILNSIIVQLQAEQDTGGSIIQHWRVEEIKKVIIPILPLDIQQTISQKIQESFKLRKESKDLLELAKTMVEEAIEKEEI